MSTRDDAPSVTDAASASGGAAVRLRVLIVARLVIMALMLGWSVSAALQIVLAALRLIGVMQGAAPDALSAIVWMVGLFALCAVALSRMDGMLRAAVTAGGGPSAVAPLLEQVTGLPLGRLRRPVTEALASSLAQMDAAAWKERAPWLARAVQHALRVERAPEARLARDGVWLIPLLDALARCERTEYLKQVAGLAEAASRRTDAPEVAHAAAAAAATLQAARERERQADTLLRPASPSEPDTLLRPAGASSESEALLRPADSTPAEEPGAQSAMAAEQQELRADR